MSNNEDYSLIRYDPHLQGVQGYRTSGSMRPVPGRASRSADPYKNTADMSKTGTLRTGQPHLTYSHRRAVETFSAAAVGQLVDIFI
ncbi:MAG: hypothetical protein MUC57_01165 [Desulfobacterales bacterium]|jgi:hypothetical protein|nr:hypothetical protein [Desulfobacterales bacterium]